MVSSVNDVEYYLKKWDAHQRTYKTSKSKKSQSRKKDEEQVRTTAY